MNDDNLKMLVSQGLAAMKAGSDVAAKATADIGDSATHPALKAALDQANKGSKQWAERIQSAIQQVGGDAQQDNPIVAAHYEVGRRIVQQAADDTSRDLGIIASGQLALHYWIASFGTMASYTGQLGMDDVAAGMKSCVDDAKQADAKYTELAGQVLTDA